MTIKSAAQRRAQQSIKEDRDSAETISFVRMGEGSYSVEDGRRTLAPLATVSLRARLSPISSREVEGSQGLLRADDMRVMLAALDLGLTLEPTTKDRITRADGSTWNVVSVQGDAVRSWWKLVVRKP